jgi:ribonuclease HII
MICGIDEAGRGPLAGPVCAAAVVLPRNFPRNILDDSKRLTAAAREAARTIICKTARAWGIGWAYAAEIDRINILQASLLAMRRAYEDMLFRAGQGNRAAFSGMTAVADGLYAPDIPVPCRPMVKADAHVPEVWLPPSLPKPPGTE